MDTFAALKARVEGTRKVTAQLSEVTQALAGRGHTAAPVNRERWMAAGPPAPGARLASPGTMSGRVSAAAPNGAANGPRTEAAKGPAPHPGATPTAGPAPHPGAKLQLFIWLDSPYGDDLVLSTGPTFKPALLLGKAVPKTGVGAYILSQIAELRKAMSTQKPEAVPKVAPKPKHYPPSIGRASRERQARTSESYEVARDHVLGCDACYDGLPCPVPSPGTEASKPPPAQTTTKPPPKAHLARPRPRATLDVSRSEQVARPSTAWSALAAAVDEALPTLPESDRSALKRAFRAEEAR